MTRVSSKTLFKLLRNSSKRHRGRVLRHEALDARHLLASDLVAYLSPVNALSVHSGENTAALPRPAKSLSFSFQSSEAEVIDLSYPGTIAQSEDITFKYSDQSIDLHKHFPALSRSTNLKVRSVSDGSVFEALPRVSEQGRLEFRVSGKPGFAGQSTITLAAESAGTETDVLINVTVENDQVDESLDDLELEEYSLVAEGEGDEEEDGSDSDQVQALHS